MTRGLACAIAGVLAAALLALLPLPAGSAVIALTPEEQTFFAEINKTRAEHGLGPVALDDGLVRAARFHSNDMVDRAYFQHGAVGRRLESFGCTHGTVGEVLGWDAHLKTAVAEIVWMLLRSPSHRAILLDPDYHHVGVGAAVRRFHGFPVAVVVTADFWSA